MALNKSMGTISPFVMRVIELGGPVCILANLLASSSSTSMLGEKFEYTDAICEAWRRILERKAPLIVEREVIPGNPDSKETFNLNDLLLDRDYLQACLDFRLDNALLTSPLETEQLIKEVKQWSKGVNVDGPLYEGGEEE